MSGKSDNRIVERVLEAVCTQLATVIGQSIAHEPPTTERATERAAGRGQIHVSFRLAFQRGAEERFGCLLVPLPDAIALASFLLMVPHDGVAAQRENQQLDETLKDAMLEIGNFIGGAVAGVLRSEEGWECSVRTRGCQGVRPDVRPAFPYVEGSPLLIGRARASLGPFPEFELILLMPVFDTQTATA